LLGFGKLSKGRVFYYNKKIMMGGWLWFGNENRQRIDMELLKDC